MKHLLTILILALGLTASAQQVDTLMPGTPKFYYQKSKENKTGALVMLIGGTALTATAIAIAAPGNVNFDDLGAVVALGGIGAAIALGSIPVFNKAARYRHKAATASVLLQPLPMKRSAGAVAAVGIRVPL